MPQSVDEHAELIRTRGYTVIPGVLTKEHVALLTNELDQIFERETKCGPQINRDNDRFRVSYCMPVKSKIFRDLCSQPKVLELARFLLGNDCVVSAMNGFKVHPGGKGQKLHLDSKDGERGLLLDILILFALDDFKRENGCTRIVPFTQNPVVPEGAVYNEFSKLFDELEDKAVYLETPAGSVIAYNNRTVHASSPNQTDRPRRAAHLLYCRNWAKPQWDFSLSMPQKVKATLTPEEYRLFGLASRPIKYDVKACDWDSGLSRRQRLKRRIKSFLLPKP